MDANRGEAAFDAGPRHYPPHSLLTYTGKIVTPFDMKPEMIDIRDIAKSLSMQARFLGHTEDFYSVAQHCYEGAVYMSEDWRSPRERMAFLLHDAAEAYMCDIPSPIKHHPIMKKYHDAQDRLQELIDKKYEVTKWAEMPIIKVVDSRMLSTEKRDIRKTDDKWPVERHFPPYSRRIWPNNHVQANAAYLFEFSRLRSEF
jgi:hypothetical protein